MTGPSDHPWKAKNGKRAAPTHPWRKRFQPLPYDADTTEAMRRQIEFQRRESDLDAVTQGYTQVEGGYRRNAVLYDDNEEKD